jgi:pSer/pThr/pTyr-binding forkhead associated (FHA) protein
VSQHLPIFKVAAEQGKHPAVGLDRPVCVVGRKDYVNLPLPAKEVSKLHALIVREQSRVYLRDLASTNGVEVNGEAVREVGLSDADIVRIGSFTLRCHSGFGQKGRRPTDGTNGDGASAPPAELRGTAGNFSFPPGRHTLLIGQREGCEARLKHPSVAPVHAVVFELDGRHYVQTFAPETATRLNGRPIHREALQPGDEILIGQVSLRYALVDLAADSMAPSAVMTDTGESLIQPALDSSIAPAIDPSHHGELEPEDAEASFDVVDGEHESLIAPAMGSSIAPAMES